jgi:hypothetical protein
LSTFWYYAVHTIFRCWRVVVWKPIYLQKGETMSTKKVIVVLLAAVLVMASFGAGTAFASTGCFSDSVGHWAETFICFLKDNGITGGFPDGTYKPENTVTRAEMAVFLQKSIELVNATAQGFANTAETNAKTYADSLVNTPPATGIILISNGFSSWTRFYSTDPISYSNFANGTYIKSSVTDTFTMVNQPPVPVSLYGKSLEFLGVEICYQTATGNNLSEVRVRTYTHSAGLASSNLRLTDNTVRTDTACRYYALGTPVLMTSEMGVEVFVDIEWTTANTEFGFGRTTYAFRPTGTNSSQLSMPPPNTTDEPAVPDTSPEVRP